MWAWVACGGGGEAAFEDQGDKVGGVCHCDCAVADQRGESVGFDFAVIAVAGGAAVAVEALACLVDGSVYGLLLFCKQLAGIGKGVRLHTYIRPVDEPLMLWPVWIIRASRPNRLLELG